MIALLYYLFLFTMYNDCMSFNNYSNEENTRKNTFQNVLKLIRLFYNHKIDHRECMQTKFLNIINKENKSILRSSCSTVKTQSIYGTHYGISEKILWCISDVIITIYYNKINNLWFVKITIYILTVLYGNWITFAYM